MGQDDATRTQNANGQVEDGALAEVGEGLATTAQQVRRTAAALSRSGRVGPGDAARGAAEAIDRAGAAAAGAARGIRRAGEAVRARRWAVVAVGGALGAGVAGLLGRALARRRRAGQPQLEWGEALERIWSTASGPGGSAGRG
ncbi:MAG: hypothetical protein QOK40_180 [Miltoncostaeaceae bacterium]|jgi:hypothetical protein|nr:hypothetical protein [Miltoncostaeaceae bacterium]